MMVQNMEIQILDFWNLLSPLVCTLEKMYLSDIMVECVSIDTNSPILVYDKNYSVHQKINFADRCIVYQYQIGIHM